jgi:type VI secretion system protein ImpH
MDREGDQEVYALLRAAANHGFVTLLSLFERLAPGPVRPGAEGPPHQEGVRLKNDPALTFPSRDVSDVEIAVRSANPFEAASERTTFEITTTFLGLTGTVSPLPAHMAEDVALEDNGVKRGFLDIFHHRHLTLLYRLLVKYDFPREFTAGASDAWSRRVLELAGLPEGGSSRLPRWRLLRLAPYLVTHARNGTTLEHVLTDLLGDELPGATFKVEEFVGSWVELDEPHQSRLGQRNSTLSSDFLLGTKLFDRGGKFRVSIGPLATTQADRLRPDGDLFPVLQEGIRLVNPDPLAHEIELRLDVGAAQPMTLSSRGTTRLGQTSWLGGRTWAHARIVVEQEG